MEMIKRFRKELGDLSELKKSIQEIGLIHPIVVNSNGELIAGQRRLRACEELGIQPIYRVVDFQNPQKAEIDENTCRKDFTPGEIYDIAQYYNSTLSQQGSRKNLNLGTNCAEVRQPREVVSEVTGVGLATLAKINKIYNSDNDELKTKVNEGILSVDKAYTELKKEARKEDIQKQIEDIQKLQQPDGLYDLIVFDPPWKYQTPYDPDHFFGRVSNPYPEMSTEELAQIKLPAAENCILWFWSTHQFIWNAKKLMDTYGFEYRSILVWNKEKMGIGGKLRYQCEFCLLGIKGNPLWTAHDIRDIITEPRREHSRKPDAFYQMIEENFYGRFLDYFSRNQYSEKWTSFGNDVDKFKVA